MQLIVKGMVCQHCVEALRRVLEGSGLTVESVELGRAVVSGEIDDNMLGRLDRMLAEQGFSRAKSADEALVERIKQTVMEHVRRPDECRLNLSACLEKHLNTPYDTLSRIFTAVEGRTIEKYQIAQRVEHVKELLGYGEHTVSEIADLTGYSSTAHLSRQFKAVTGLTPTQYLRGRSTRVPLGKI